MNMNLQLFSRGAPGSAEETKEKKTKNKAAVGVAAGENAAHASNAATVGATNQGANGGAIPTANGAAYSAASGAAYSAANGATYPAANGAVYPAANAAAYPGVSVEEQDTDVVDQIDGAIAGGQQGKPLTLEERIGRLEALLETHRDTAHSAQSYEQARKERQAASQTQLVQDTFRKLQAQAQEAQQLYPNLNLAQEAKDPRFVELLKCGLDVKSAFEVVHKDEIIAASMEYAAREVERLLTNKVLAQQGRPTENGGIHGPSLSKTDPKYMTRQERKDIIRRVFAGEKITF